MAAPRNVGDSSIRAMNVQGERPGQASVHPGLPFAETDLLFVSPRCPTSSGDRGVPEEFRGRHTDLRRAVESGVPGTWPSNDVFDEVPLIRVR